MPAIRPASAAVLAFLFFPMYGSVIAQNSTGNQATILLDSGAITPDHSINQVGQSQASGSDTNRARVLFPPQPERPAGHSIRVDNSVAPASFVIQDRTLVNTEPPLDSGVLPDEKVNPFDPDTSSRVDFKTPHRTASEVPAQGFTASDVSFTSPPIPILPDSDSSQHVPPPPVMSKAVDLSFAWQNKPRLGQLQSGSPALPSPNEQIPQGIDSCRPLFYLDLFGGVNEYDSGFGRSIISNSTSTSVDFESGYNFGSRLGIYQGQNLRTDFEFSFQFGDVTTQHSFSAPGQPPQSVLLATTQGDLTTWTGLSNVYWDFSCFPTERIRPYVGAGIGFLYASADLTTYDPSGTPPFLDTDSSLAFQIMIGGSYEVTSRLDLFGEYRYLDADAVTLCTETGIIANGMNAPASFTQPTQIDLSGDSVVFGLRMKF